MKVEAREMLSLPWKFTRRDVHRSRKSLAGTYHPDLYMAFHGDRETMELLERRMKEVNAMADQLLGQT